MKEILLTSSILILALLVLRLLFQKSISRRVQYALWGLVLLRLLIPVNLPALEHNVLTAAEPVQTQVTQQLEQQQVYVLPVDRSPISDYPQADGQTPGTQVVSGDSFGYNVVSQDGTTVTKYAEKLSLSEVLRLVWYAGIFVCGCWFVISNFLFWRKICKARTPYSIEGSGYPVYLVERGLPSPCLFGLFRPAIYLTPAAVSSPDSLRHVLAHEITHARHLDPLWSLLRGVCLAIYWFDPLVWVAAIASKRDCELACDEGALQQLGEDQRIAYGRTLLALIPVVKKPMDPMLSATTMTEGKRQLKDRLTRITENRKTAGAALFAVAALAAAVCAVTFTGAKVAAAEGSRSLTSDELQYFNEEFFNTGYPNIRNQFLSSIYETPEDIDLFQLFYDGTGLPGSVGDEERAAVVAQGYDGFDPDVDLTKCTTADMDAVLTEYMGLTLAETSQVGLSDFTYLADYGAYYHFHGDTNYRSEVTITTGEREGNTIRLYYLDDFMDEGWKCVTLRETDSGYQFVSNLTCDQPGSALSLPDWEPALTIPLSDLTPYVPEAVTVEHSSGDVAEWLDQVSVSAEYFVYVFRSTDGNLYATVGRTPSADFQGHDCFLTLPDENFTLGAFYDLWNHDGVLISYYGQVSGNQYGTINDYYYITDDGAPVLLARAYGETEVVDLDSDGVNELAASTGSSAQIFFQRDGQLYEADIETLVSEAWPEVQYLSFGYWGPYSRSLALSGSIASGGNDLTAFRALYFDGENLLVYKDNSTYTDHVKDGIDVPSEVLSAAREYVMSQFVQGVPVSDENGEITYGKYDDWRISSLTGPFSESAGDLDIEIWRLDYQCHTSTTQNIVLAGGRYVTEDYWVSPGYPDCDYLYFQLSADGQLTYLYSQTENDCLPGSELFYSDMAYRLTDLGLLDWTKLDAEQLYALFRGDQPAFFNTLGGFGEAEQQGVLQTLSACANTGADLSWDSSVNYASSMDDLLMQDTSSLTDSGRAAYARLLAVLEDEPASVGAEAHDAPTDAVISNAILAYCGSVWASGSDFYAEAHQIVAQEDNGDTYAVYAMICCRGDSLENNAWTTKVDGQSPVIITFVWENGDWQVRSCWEPRSGSFYASDLRARFPSAAAETVLKDTAAWAELRSQCEAAAALNVPQITVSQYDSYEEARSSVLTGSCTVFQELEGSAATVLSWGYVGTPHGTQAQLDVFYADGAVVRLPLLPRNAWGLCDPPENLTVSADGTTLTYTMTADNDMWFSSGAANWRRTGTYRFVYDIAAKTVTMTVS